MSRPTREAKSKALEKIDKEDAKDNECELPLLQRIAKMKGLPLNHYVPSTSSKAPPATGRGLQLLAKKKQGPAICTPGGDVIVPKNHSRRRKILEKMTNCHESDSGSDGEISDSSSDSADASSDNSDSGDSDDSDTDQDSAGRDGTVWHEVTNERGGRLSVHNIFRAKPGPTNYCRNVTEAVDAWRLFLDDGLLRHIKECTLEYGRSIQRDFSLELFDIEAFIGLMYTKGAMNNKNFPYDLHWSSEYGCDIFKKTMARDQFRAIKRMLRFDVRSSRRERLSTDKYALMSLVHNRLVENFQRAYVPEVNLTVDEQLFPTKSRCPFLQFMASKPDKYGIKNWVLVETDSKYCLNVIPYLGRDDNRVESLGSHVVTSLMSPYFNKGYNLCMDNFFTSYQLACTLVEKSTSLVGTVRANRRELPPITDKLALHKSRFFQSGQVNLVCYQGKKNKSVFVMSTMHRGNACQQEGKMKPESVTCYNKMKCGVDLMDSMCKAMTTKSGSRRWPFSVFCNLLDITAINAWIIFKKKTGAIITRRDFLFLLGEQLVAEKRHITSSLRLPPAIETDSLENRVECRLRINCTKNRTLNLCNKCRLPVCGQCQAKLCIKCEQ